jgi:non-homologous end joining protein Ku
MAPRANWKGFLRLSLVTCPIALYPATSESDKISFNQINKKTGHRIKYAKVDSETDEEADRAKKTGAEQCGQSYGRASCQSEIKCCCRQA